jgi:hypothetical protein
MKTSKQRAAIFCILTLSILVAGGWVVRWVRQQQAASQEIVCKGHGFGVAYALHKYNETHGTFPPATLQRNGTTHSWRILVSEYLGSSAYRTYDYDQPWNSPQNITLQNQITSPLRCGSRGEERYPYATPYVAVTGPNCVLRDDSYPCRTPTELDSDIIMLVETRRNDIHWMSPEDLKYSDLIADPDYAAKVLGGPHPHGGHYITVGAHIGRINDIGIPALLERMLVPASTKADPESGSD